MGNPDDLIYNPVIPTIKIFQKKEFWFDNNFENDEEDQIIF